MWTHHRRAFVLNRRILNTDGVQVAEVRDTTIYDMKGGALFSLRGQKIYKPTGELVGQFSAASGSDIRLDKATERLFLS
jgi:hypothetical protein